MSTPAQVIRRLLIQLNLCGDHTVSAANWPSFVGFLPDVPDQSLVVYDTAGVKQGRLMRGGEVITKPGIQIRVRSQVYPGAHGKAKDIAEALDALPVGTIVTMIPTSEKWFIQNVSRTGDILTAGMEEEGDRKRFNFTVNAILTMREET